MKAKKLIEVAMPIKEISAESVRDKSIRHGHISTLHLWWARRPLPTCRAVVFASLVPDPLDENCPQAFRDAVECLLNEGIAKVAYAPYPDIPYTAVYDPMEDNLRNRLLMFIGKFSDKCQQNMLAGKTTSPKEQIHDGCLIKWENKNNPDVLMRARKLIWVAYNAEKGSLKSFTELSAEFDSAFDAIKKAEEELYNTPNRHIATDDVKAKETALQNAIDSFQANMPSVFDPFAGGGAIPLEAARLGCRSFGNDINPVAHIIEKGSVEFPQKYGKPITFSMNEFMNAYGEEGLKIANERGIVPFGDTITLHNRLSFDVEFYAKKLIKMTKDEIGWMYPEGSNDGSKLIAYYWARTAKCSNPSCGAEVPFLKQFVLSKDGKGFQLRPTVKGNKIDFSVVDNSTIYEGWNNRGNLTCPCCGNLTPISKIKENYKEHGCNHRLLAVIEEKNGHKHVRLPNDSEFSVLEKIPVRIDKPQEYMEVKNNRNFNTPGWGISRFGEMFSDRQYGVIDCLLNNLDSLKTDLSDSEYGKSIICYLAILINRVTPRFNTLALWNVNAGTIEHIFGRQAIPMSFDYPESYVFGEMTGSINSQVTWIVRYIESECSSEFWCTPNNAVSGDHHQFEPKSLTAVVTDPPYYDAIAYGDISDFFYIWFKRTLNSVYPLTFSTPLTPKSEECTALKHHHNDSEQDAKKHFEEMLLKIFTTIEVQTTDCVSIMFAHQSTEAWTTLCNSILGANMNITGSWAIDSERSNAGVKIGMSYLESSVTVACTPSRKNSTGSYKKVKKAIQENVAKEVRTLYELGFRGADLLTACFGKAVSEFGNYETVEKADGSEVTVAELLDMARTAAFTALLRDFDGDDYTKFYIGWLQLNGMGETDFDDATKFTRVGMNVNIGDIFAHGLLVKDQDGNKQHLCTYKESAKNGLAILPMDAPLIDKVHHVMWHWAEGNRQLVLKLINEYGPDINNEFWRVFVVLKELLPADSDDSKQVTSLLSNSENLIRESKETQKAPTQATLFDIMDE